MTKSEGGEQLLTFPTFVIGPESQGRGYRLLKGRADGLRTSDLAMILMEWARLREAAIVGRVPVKGGTAIFRAQYLERASLGDVAHLNGIVIDTAQLACLGHRPELLLQFIPVPDGTTSFAEQALRVLAVPRAPALSDWPGLGLAWRDRLILVSAAVDREKVLLEALASIEPSEQRERIKGWVTTTRLESRGELNLLDQSQLIVADVQGMARLPHLPYHLQQSDHNTGETVGAPQSWQAWTAYQSILSSEPAFARAQDAEHWEPSFSSLPADQLIDQALRAASGVLPHERMIDLLMVMIASSGSLARAAHRVVPDYLEALNTQDVGRRSLRRLLSVVAAMPTETIGRLLDISDSDTIGQLDDASISILVRQASEIVLSQDVVARPGLRRAIIDLICGAVVRFPPGAPEYITLRYMVRHWPSDAKRDLIALTFPEVFAKIARGSGGLARDLAEAVLNDRDFRSGGSDGMAALSNSLSALALLEA